MPDLDWPTLVAYSRQMSGWLRLRHPRLTAEDVQDIAIEALMRAWLHRASIDGEQNVRGWLKVTADRIAIDLLRYRGRRPWFSLDVDARDNGHLRRRDEETTVDVPDPAETPEMAALRAETVAEVRAVLAELSADDRACLLACTSDTMMRAATMLGLPLPAFKSRYYRAVRRFRARWLDVA